MVQRVKHLVVDSGAFIKNFPIHEYAENVYSVSGAVEEIRDKASKQRLQVLPYDLKLKSPEPENYKYVADFSKKTGDYSSLSVTDLQIISLTYQLEKEFVGTEHLNKEPVCQVSGASTEATQPLPGFYYPQKEESDTASEKCSVSDSHVSSNSDSRNIDTLVDDSISGSEKHNYSNEIVDGDKENDDGSWITPFNFSEVQKKMGNLSLDSCSDLTVACVTTDFAIQNVMLQMGLHVISVDGMLIQHTRVFILRCFACFKTTTNTTKKFCPNCGNNTLKRVSVTVKEDGSKNVHINFKKPINIRGTKYSLPMPQGGKHPKNPILCEDQPLPHNRLPKAALHKTDAFSPDYVTMKSPFAIHDIHSRAAGLGIQGLVRGNRRKNPNEWSKRTGNKK